MQWHLKISLTSVILFTCLVWGSFFLNQKITAFETVLNESIKINQESREKTTTLITTLKSQLKKQYSEIQELVIKESLHSVSALTVTSYSPRPQETDRDPYIAASMRPVREGTIAVSRDLFKKGWVFGKKVYIEGFGMFEINDLMAERYSNSIDIFRFSTKKAVEFGRKQLNVSLTVI